MKKNKLIIGFILLFVVSFVSSNTKASEFVEYGQSIRALGLGGAYTSVVEDTDVLFYNPAGLAQVKGMNWKIFGFNAGVNMPDAASLSKIGKSENGDAFDGLYGTPLWAGLGGKTVITLPNFGFGGYDSGSLGFQLNNPAFPNLNLGYLNDYGFVMGGAFPLTSFFSIGISGKRVVRTGGSGPVGLSTISAGNPQSVISSFNGKGSGYGIDIGMLIRPPAGSILRPSLAAVWKDAGHMTFLKDNGYSTPPTQLGESILGLGLEVDVPFFSFLTAIDYKHANSTGVPLGKKLHMGLELGIPFLDIRAGFGQGYSAIGASLDLIFFRLDTVSYGVELGEYPGQHESRRYQIELSMEIGFDPSFNLMDLKGGKRRLKQRR